MEMLIILFIVTIIVTVLIFSWYLVYKIGFPSDYGVPRITEIVTRPRILIISVPKIRLIEDQKEINNG